MLSELQKAGGALLNEDEKKKLQAAMWSEGKLNPALMARPVEDIVRTAQLDRAELKNASFLMVEETGVGHDSPFSGEKLSLVLTLYKAPSFDAAFETVRRIYEYQGAGHSVGIHTRDDAQVLRLGLEMPAARVIVNQAHAIANGGAYDNALPFSLSMGCGTWGRNSISDNMNYRHYLNITRIVRPIAPRVPTIEGLFGAYHRKHGR
jgi:sulfoacetaldehyde dehydrogenase